MASIISMSNFLKLIILLVLLGSFVFIIKIVQAQQQTDSNTIRTIVGNPVTQASSCPIPGASPSCGSRNEPRNNCGHCGIGYENYPCSYPSLAYALDIPGGYGQNVLLPTIGNSSIRWSFQGQDMKTDGRTAIQRYGGTNEETGEQYLIKFHHAAPGSASGIKYSGEVGTRICDAPCEVGSGPHIHIEFAQVNDNGSYTWLEAPSYFCGG